MALDEIRSERVKKLEKFREQGINPYPAEAHRTHSVAEVLKKFGTFAKSKKKISLAGRIIAKREHGGSMFLDLQDGSGKIQVYFKADVLKEQYTLVYETVDIGDFVEVEGKLFKTKRGEETLEVMRWKMLAKSLRPLPEKWHGLQDVEERFRKRYLDLLMNEGIKERFELRAKIIKLIREIHEKNGFLEVETPMLHPIPGGALARPFKTHHNALDIELYLRIAKELYLKRLLIGGLERIFEIGKDFRNEGIDMTHNPEFTMFESYAAFWNEEQMMDFVEGCFIELSKHFAKKGLEYEGKKINFKKPFARITFKDLLARYAQITNYDRETRDSLATRAKQFGIDIATHESKPGSEISADRLQRSKGDNAEILLPGKGKIADEIYKKICRPYLVQPTFVTNHPLDISPLAKRQEKNSEEVRRFQLIIAGLELANGFAELNDPLDQRVRLETQEKERQGGEEEAHRIDEDYLEAMEYGMPNAAGLGIGIDRVVMLFSGTKNVREVVLFPTMRSKI